jgi:hypothetical protein
MVYYFTAELHKIMLEIQLTEIITTHYSCLKSFPLYTEVDDDFKRLMLATENLWHTL